MKVYFHFYPRLVQSCANPISWELSFIWISAGGAGGKGTWGAIGEVLTDEDMKIRDQHDPNYESEEDEDVGVSSLCHNMYFVVSIVFIFGESQT